MSDEYENLDNKQTYIVKDERSALKMKREEARASREKYKAVVAREREEANAQRELKKQEIKLELAKIRMSQSASEKARTNIALTTPAILVLLIGGFIVCLACGSIPDESISVASALLTLLVTGLMANLRSIISEGTGTEENGKPVKKLGSSKPTPPQK